MRSIKSFRYAPNSHKAKDWQKAVTKTLGVLDGVCRDNGIHYSLCFGGLLGAVRHQGFIPWDNDVDVVMFEPDYLKLQALAKNRALPEGYGFVDRATEEDYPLLFGRFIDLNTSCPLSTSSFNGGAHGVFVDVFILFPLNDDPAQRQAQVTDFLVWEELQCWLKRRASLRTRAFVERWQQIKEIEKAEGRQQALRTIEDSFRSRTPDHAEWCFHGSGGAYNGFPSFKSAWFEDTAPVPFEEIQLMAPVQAPEVLQRFYGSGWRLFPAGEKFKPYAASSITIPGPVITHDYMQLIDGDEAVATLRACKEAEMEQVVTRSLGEPAYLETQARLAARDLNARYQRLVSLAKQLLTPEAVAAPSAASDFGVFDQVADDILSLQNHGPLKQGHRAAPVSPMLLSAGLWAHYLRQPDFWSVEKAVAAQNADPARCAFSDTECNRLLRRVLAATDALYLAIDRQNVQEAAAQEHLLESCCPSGRHAAVARAFALVQRALDNPDDAQAITAAADEAAHALAQWPDDDYLQLFAAQTAVLKGDVRQAEGQFASLGQTCMNGMILQACARFCREHGLAYQQRPLARIPAQATESAAHPVPPITMLTLLHHGIAGIGEGLHLAVSGALKTDSALKEESQRIAPLEARIQRYRDYRRLTDRRFNAWERTYPRKQALLQAAQAGRMNEVRRYAKPYLDAVYRLFDKEHLGVFIDQDIYEACKPLFIADRGAGFLKDYEALVPQPHRRDIDQLLREAGVPHPYLQPGYQAIPSDEAGTETADPGGTGAQPSASDH